MSSSRSIAAARNRRAGEQQPQMSRPGTSIAAQPAFSQQQPQLKKSYTAPNSTPNVPVAAISASTTKLSISDAIGLITLRLGRVEQILIEMEHNGGFTSTSTSSIPDNTQLIDKSVINSIVNRLDSLEKKEKEKEKEPSSNNQTTKLEGEIRDIKDLLMTQILKYEKFTLETKTKFDDFKQNVLDCEEAIAELEKRQELTNCCTELEADNELALNEIIISESTISSNLKSAIEQELAESV